MSSEYLNFLDATINYLEELQKNGTKYICVDQEILNELSKPVKIGVKTGGKVAPTNRNVRTGEVSSTKSAETPAKPIQKQIFEKPAARTEKTDIIETATVFQQELGAMWTMPELAPEQKAAALAQLREQVLACKKCPHLVSFRHNVVFGVGNPNAKLMFVGEAPGEDEDLQGEPFVGKAGQLLTKIIQTMGLSREIVYIANILKCRPDVQTRTGNRPPTPQEMKTCVPYLHQQIEIIRPKVIVALGATAVEGLLGQKVQITKFRGTWQEFRGIPVMPTYHPSYLLRNQAIAVKREVWTDMLKVMEKLGMEISEKQRNYFTKSSSI